MSGNEEQSEFFKLQDEGTRLRVFWYIDIQNKKFEKFKRKLANKHGSNEKRRINKSICPNNILNYVNNPKSWKVTLSDEALNTNVKSQEDIIRNPLLSSRYQAHKP